MERLYFGFEQQNTCQHQNEVCTDRLKIRHLQKRTDHIVHQNWLIYQSKKKNY